jgi:hypothetical protein
MALRDWCNFYSDKERNDNRAVCLTLLMFMTPKHIHAQSDMEFHWAKLYISEYIPKLKEPVESLNWWARFIYENGRLEGLELFKAATTGFS